MLPPRHGESVPAAAAAAAAAAADPEGKPPPQRPVPVAVEQVVEGRPVRGERAEVEIGEDNGGTVNLHVLRRVLRREAWHRRAKDQNLHRREVGGRRIDGCGCGCGRDCGREGSGIVGPGEEDDAEPVRGHPRHQGCHLLGPLAIGRAGAGMPVLTAAIASSVTVAVAVAVAVAGRVEHPHRDGNGPAGRPHPPPGRRISPRARKCVRINIRIRIRAEAEEAEGLGHHPGYSGAVQVGDMWTEGRGMGCCAAGVRSAGSVMCLFLRYRMPAGGITYIRAKLAST